MWAYEVYLSDLSVRLLWSTFENDGVLEHRILKVNDWIPHIKSLGQMQSIFHRCLNLIHTDIIQGIIQK